MKSLVIEARAVTGKTVVGSSAQDPPTRARTFSSRPVTSFRLGDGEPVARVVGVSFPRQGLPPLS
jgi:hypothetical protein